MTPNPSEPRRPGTAPAVPPEWPDGSYALVTTGRRVSVLIREDDPDDAANPHRWRSVEGNSRWFTWVELHATARLQRLYTGADLAARAAAATRHPAGHTPAQPPPPTKHTRPAPGPPPQPPPPPEADIHPRPGMRGGGRR